MKETGNRCAAPNYEAMYEIQAQDNNKLREENARLHEKLKAIQRAHDTLSAQMDVVRLIFGGNR